MGKPGEDDDEPGDAEVAFQAIQNMLIRNKNDDTRKGLGQHGGGLRAKDIFMNPKFNPNRDGLLDVNELRRIIKMAGYNVSLKDCQALFSEMDQDGTGEVDHAEFSRALRARSQLDRKGRAKAKALNKRPQKRTNYNITKVSSEPKRPFAVPEEEDGSDRDGGEDDDLDRRGNGPRYTLGPHDPPPYGDTQCGPAYWDARYAQAGDDSFDWYVDYSRMKDLLSFVLSEPHLKPEASPEILDLGCGTSEMAAELWRDGWKNVVGIDTSSVAISRAHKAYAHRNKPELQFLCMDARDMAFPDACFDVVLDKGLLDTLASGGHAFPRIKKLLSETHRVMRPQGVFILVSHANVGARLPYLVMDDWGWQIEVGRLAKPPGLLATSDRGEGSGNGFFNVYICTKQGDGSVDAAAPAAAPSDAKAAAPASTGKAPGGKAAAPADAKAPAKGAAPAAGAAPTPGAKAGTKAAPAPSPGKAAADSPPAKAADSKAPAAAPTKAAPTKGKG